MKNMRAVLVNENAGVIQLVIGVAADMRPAVYHKHFLIALTGNPFGKHAAGKSSPHDEPVIHVRPRRSL